MGILVAYGYLWKSYGNLWIFNDIYGYLWNFMEPLDPYMKPFAFL